MKDIKRFFAYMGEYKLHYWTILVVTLIIESALQILYSYVTKQTLNAVEYQNMELFKVAVIICAVIVLLKCAFPYLRYLQIRLVRKMVYERKLELFSKLMSMNMEYFDQTHSAEALKTLNWDANSLKDSWFSHVYWVLGKVVLVTSSIITMCIYSPELTVISLVISAVTAYVSIYMNKAIKKSAKKVQVRSSKLASHLSDILCGFITLKMNPGASIVMEHFHKENEEVTAQEKGRVRLEALLEMSAFLLGILGSFGTIVAGALLAANGSMDYGTVMAVVTLQMGVSSAMQRFGSSLSAFSTSLVRANHVFDFLELEQEESIEHKYCESSEMKKSGEGIKFSQEKSWNEAKTLNQADPSHQLVQVSQIMQENQTDHAIEIKDLHYAYQEKLQELFGGKSLSVGLNEKILLAGESGCGKSTLLKLLLGLYEVEDGQIRIYGKDINAYSLEKLRDMITYIPQDSYLFEGTIAENIAYGRQTADVSHADIVRAARSANAAEFIEEFPDGYDTKVTAGGMNFSGGQRQRIAIARALLKDAPIVLMDEPSSALDRDNEKIILESMNELMKDKTVIMVTHRMVGTNQFDRVVQM